VLHADYIEALLADDYFLPLGRRASVLIIALGALIVQF
jgi:hypothetical protein